MEPVKLCKRGHERTPENVDSHGTCKQCTREKYLSPEFKEARKKHPSYGGGDKEKQRISQRKHYLANKEKIIQRSYLWRNTNYQRYIECVRKRYLDKPELWAANAQKWRDNHREYCISRSREAIDNMSPHYIAGMMGFKKSELTDEIIELKRLTLKLKRSLKNVKQP